MSFITIIGIDVFGSRIKKILFFLFLFFTGIISLAQEADDLTRFNELVKNAPDRGYNGANKKFHALLQLSEKLNFPEKKCKYLALIMADHYYNLETRNDSCLYYLEKVKQQVAIHEKSMSITERVDMYRRIGFIEAAFFGYNVNVVDYYGKAYDLALSIQDEKDIFYIKNHIAELIVLRGDNKLDQINEVITDLENALQVYPKNVYRFVSYNALAQLYFAKNDLTSAKIWIDKTLNSKSAIDASPEWYDRYKYWEAQNLLSYYFYKQGEVYKAIDILNAATNSFDSFSGQDNDFTLMYYHYFLYYSQLGDIEKALSYITKACDSPLSIYEKIFYRDQMVRFLYKIGNHSLAKKVNQEKLKLLSQITVSDSNMFSKFLINELQKKDLEVAQNVLTNTNLQLKEKNITKTNQVLWLTIALILVLIAILIYVFVKRGKKKDKTIVDLRLRESRVLEELVAQRENELQLVALKVTNKLSVLKELKEEIEKITQITPEVNTLRTKVNTLISSGTELAEVSDRLQTQYPGICYNLKESHPDLSETEVKYCLLTKLNLSLKETANILMVSPDTVKHSRSRIKRKMKIPKELSLKNYMDQISNEKRIVA
ncbi:hypothetical protein D1818_22420 [Aquimarina sp. BL5]|uniref:hypothetical protein n=1 Tax=Aquimarina sp. BL5 TaxID=1714860 RepID=UPI000E5004D2|nr:hypothetical protein [Aquimarina sp. BL5]AXT53446.1 hypothetical protein D1818_22420 [Aquimarina sp. BL5]RKN08850.1 hypothetical protein D7036_04890 [Aquimarina sp. BL5]